MQYLIKTSLYSDFITIRSVNVQIIEINDSKPLKVVLQSKSLGSASSWREAIIENVLRPMFDDLGFTLENKVEVYIYHYKKEEDPVRSLYRVYFNNDGSCYEGSPKEDLSWFK